LDLAAGNNAFHIKSQSGYPDKNLNSVSSEEEAAVLPPEPLEYVCLKFYLITTGHLVFRE
jgi:hypothetical protein